MASTRCEAMVQVGGVTSGRPVLFWGCQGCVSAIGGNIFESVTGSEGCGLASSRMASRRPAPNSYLRLRRFLESGVRAGSEWLLAW
jgi:hypothetical protein